MSGTIATDDGGSAFPMPSGPEPRVNETTHYNEGMSLRDHIASIIAPAMINQFYHGVYSGQFGFSEGWRDELALEIYRFSDSMIRARKAGKE